MPLPPGLSLLPATSGVVPTEGSKVGVFPISWANTTPFGSSQLNLLQQWQSGQFTAPQCVFIDNSTNCYSVQIMCLQTGHTLKVPPFTSGLYPLLSSQSPSYAINLLFPNAFIAAGAAANILSVTTTFYFLNTQQAPFINPFPLYGNIFSHNTYNANNIGGALATIINTVPSNAMILINSYTMNLFSPGSGANTTYIISGNLIEINNGSSVYIHDIFSLEFTTNAAGNAQAAITPRLYTFPVNSFALGSSFGLQFSQLGGALPNIDIVGAINYGLVIVE